MDLVDIDKVLDELEDQDIRSNGNHRPAPRNLKNVFSSLNDYVNYDLIGAAGSSSSSASASRPIIRKFANPNYAFADRTRTYSSSSDETPNGGTASSGVDGGGVDGGEENGAVGGELAVSSTRFIKQESRESHVTTYFDESTSSDSTCPSSGPDSDLTTTTDSGEEERLARERLIGSEEGEKRPEATTLSATFSNEVMNLEGISSLSSIVEITSNYNKLKSDCKEEENGGGEIASKTSEFIVGGEGEEDRKVGAVEVVEKRPVVGFESTMDDVSDAELESYLQELEEEVQREPEAAVVEEERPVVEEGPKEEEEGDNISKASTIEFEPPTPPSPSETVESTNQVEPGVQANTDSIKFVDSSVTEAKEEPEIPVEADDPPQESISVEEAVEVRGEVARPNSLELATTTEEALPTDTAPSSPGHTPPPTPRGDLDPGMTSTSSSEELSAALPASSPAPPGTESPPQSSAAFDLANGQLGKQPPFWIPDSYTNNCMQCGVKFSLIKRRHHCRACGQLLCSACCCLKAKLDYMGEAEARICIQCDHVLSRAEAEGAVGGEPHRPNPNNPMEYCSKLPPHQQVSQGSGAPISVMVPVGVLKREGQSRPRKDKNVIFSDGIRPGCDLTDLDTAWDTQAAPTRDSISRRKGGGRAQTPPGAMPAVMANAKHKVNVNLPPVDEATRSYIPRKEAALPPVYTQTKTEFKFTDVTNDAALITRLHTETLRFALQRNFYVICKIIKLTCCVNKTVINFTTHGLHHVGQDEIIILLEMDDSNQLPKDIFLHLNDIYNEADKGNTITELGFSMAPQPTPTAAAFLGSKEHGGFLYIRSSFQCMQNVQLPAAPYLIGVLIHRWEVPWAKIFPLRLMLRLGALYRYYPAPHISVRGRDSVYAEIAQTIINFLADFRTYSYTLPTIRGMVIHMEDRRTSVLIPRNRYDQVMKALGNASDHILALAGNFSRQADGHLVCIQNIESNAPEQLHSYSTQAINIQGQPRKVTGASFIVLNGALKTTSGLSGKCSIVEDGLMVQILPAKMTSIREALKNMKDVEIVCGPVEAEAALTETVTIQWTENDLNFNIGVISPIDRKQMDGIPSIRVHRGLDYSNTNHMIRWTEVFIIKSDDDSAHGRDPVDISRLSEQIARSTCQALVCFLDLLAANDLLRIGLRVTLDPENVCYEAGSQYNKLAPLYMNALDNELVATLHRQTSSLNIDTTLQLELIFHILDK